VGKLIRTLRTRIELVVLAFGWRGMFRRAWYVAQLRAGWFRWRYPASASFDSSPAVKWRHRFDVAEMRRGYAHLELGDEHRDLIIKQSERLLEGEHPLFGWTTQSVGWPPRWNQHPFTAEMYPMVHWTRVSDDDPARGDIKDIWELSRFGLTYSLARAYVLTDDDQYPEAWWAALESWAANNQPNTGVNWRCGQESSLRGITWCFGYSLFADHISSTPARVELFERLLGATQRRVRPTLGYALSQRNNHAISELVFLLSLSSAPESRLCGLLVEALDDQFFDDGSYSQQSPVYERLAIHALIWLMTVQPELPGGLRNHITDVLNRAGGFFERISDPVSGEFINYGPNDGSLLFAVTEAGHLDALATLAMLGRNVSSAKAQEAAIWLSAPGRATTQTGPSTYISLRSDRTLLATRIGGIARRAADADQQAIELFIDGERVVIDPGTFRYSGRTPWRNPFVGLDTHCAVMPLSGSADASIGRFLRQPMNDAEVVAHVHKDGLDVLSSQRHQNGCMLLRTIVRSDHRYAVVDQVTGGDAVVRWNLGVDETLAAGVPTQLRGGAAFTIRGTQAPRRLVRIESDPLSGWWSPSYAQIEQCAVIEVPIRDGGQAVALFSPAGTSVLTESDLAAALDGPLQRSFAGLAERTGP
jgi:hypothetical protein